MCCSYYHSIIENIILATNKMIPPSHFYDDNDVLIVGGTVFPGTEWTGVRRLFVLSVVILNVILHEPLDPGDNYNLI